MSATYDSMGLSVSDSGLTGTADRLIVDQEVASSSLAPSIHCHSTSQYSLHGLSRLRSAGQGFLSTTVDSTDNKNFAVGSHQVPVPGAALHIRFPAAVKLVAGVAERVDAKL